MTTETLEKVLKILKEEIKKWKVPAVGVIAERAIDRPFETLISTVLSLRTKYTVTEVASRRLLEKGSTPAKILLLSQKEIEILIYTVGSYRIQPKKVCE